MRGLMEIHGEDVFEKFKNLIKEYDRDIQLLGTDRDYFLYNLFGRADIEESLNCVIADHMAEDKGEEKAFAKHLLSHPKDFNNVVDDAFSDINHYFDSDYGINNETVLNAVDNNYKDYKEYMHRAKRTVSFR